MKKQLILVTLIATSLLISPLSFANTKEESVDDLKSQILEMAKSFEGQGDPDQSKQNTLEPLVEKLIQANPMPPVKDRISTLAGAWKQVWGPYDYRNDAGGVDPKLGVKEIYQVVFADGFYYNVAPYYPNENINEEQIGLLRGEFKLDASDPTGLRVKFTDYPGVDPRPTGMEIWELAAIAEAGQLQNKVTIVPSWIVKFFFGGGKLEEVYTDKDMRILYGSKGKPGARRSLYVMTRMN